MRIEKPFHGDYRISQVFGVNKSFYSRWGMEGHNGIDYALPVGTPVLACDDGEAVKGFDENGYGRYVKITHTWGISLYGHLSQWEGDIRQGKKGQRIGLSGNTGVSTGPHLHFEIRVNPIDHKNGYLGRVDPMPYLSKPATKPVLPPIIIPEDKMNERQKNVVGKLGGKLDNIFVDGDPISGGQYLLVTRADVDKYIAATAELAKLRKATGMSGKILGVLVEL